MLDLQLALVAPVDRCIARLIHEARPFGTAFGAPSLQNYLIFRSQRLGKPASVRGAARIPKALVTEKGISELLSAVAQVLRNQKKKSAAG
ncbi:hypothetical protein EV696_11824 [Permianibacter aggregans]|uniref:Uncharacterized protein n=1 Tax=Permianibacter aggregans TaxID=1510150 RepID=A0A4R6UFY9_9GAMM|nr:hypothetical protein EV696_11824 [Permianibacter aggregans]